MLVLLVSYHAVGQRVIDPLVHLLDKAVPTLLLLRLRSRVGLLRLLHQLRLLGLSLVLSLLLILLLKLLLNLLLDLMDLLLCLCLHSGQRVTHRPRRRHSWCINPLISRLR